MSTAIFLIVIAGFLGRLAIAAIAMRSWLLVGASTLAAAGIYAMPHAAGFSVRNAATALHLALPLGLVVLVCAVMSVVGFGVPALLASSELASRRWKVFTFAVSVLATILVFDLWRVAGSLFSARWFFITPEFWFVTGAGCFLVFKSRFFEDDPGEKDRAA